MDIVSPVLDIFSRLWTCCAHNTGYVRKLKQNLTTFENLFNSLRCQRDDVIRRIEMAETNPIEPAKCTNLISDWLQRVQACQPDPLQQIPIVEVVGMDAKFNEVLEYLVTDGNNVGTVGLYGMGGVGKTTLLRKVNNEFVERKHFGIVIFVVVSKDLNLRSIQNLIGTKLGLSWTEETQMYDS
ncbi:hypothetical protein MKX01_002599 [Papaver californicum]|nr:hypothetical protein MKX01_002599 [Papaver californicum]